MAPNGFGKSTLLKTLNGIPGLLKSGAITCDEISIIDTDEAGARKRTKTRCA